jgi:hypothetical protein
VTNPNLKVFNRCVFDRATADEAALDYIATRIARKFGVSAEVIAKRLRVEKSWPPQ